MSGLPARGSQGHPPTEIIAASKPYNPQRTLPGARGSRPADRVQAAAASNTMARTSKTASPP